MFILKKWMIYFRKRLSRKRAVSGRKPIVQGVRPEEQKGPPLVGPSHYIPYPKR